MSNSKPPKPNTEKFDKALAFLKERPRGASGAEIATHADVYFDHFARTLKRKGIALFSRPDTSGKGKGSKKIYSLDKNFENDRNEIPSLGS